MTYFNWAPYQRATYCVGGPRPGTVALAAYIEERFPQSWFGNIYSCRNIVGGTGRSHHAEGRACNIMHGTASPSVGYEIVKMLGPHGYRLGLDHAICNLQPWAPSWSRGAPRTFAAAYPDGKYYSGSHPHKDHVHLGLTRIAAERLTLATIRYVVEGKLDAPIEGIDVTDFITIAGYKFYDYKKWPSWGVDAIKRAIETGKIRGRPYGTDPQGRIFDAQAPVTRGELAAIGDRAPGAWY